MASAQYNKSSPYADTETYGFFLDITTFRDIPAIASDVVYQITLTYKFRPDLLAYDLYGDSALWWVFAMRNPNTIQDPIFDFLPGTTIFIPKKEIITTALGL
jgi:prophage DNA circulation protein